MLCWAWQQQAGSAWGAQAVTDALPAAPAAPAALCRPQEQVSSLQGRAGTSAPLSPSVPAGCSNMHAFRISHS